MQQAVRVQYLPSRVQGAVPEGALDRSGMYQVAREFFGSLLYDGEELEAEHLLDEVPVEEEGKGRGSKVAPQRGRQAEKRVVWEVRYREIQVPELSVVAGNHPMSPRPWADLLDHLYGDKLKELKSEQPQARWELVACLIEQADVAATFTKRGVGATTGPQDAYGKAGAGAWSDSLTTRVGRASETVQAKNLVLRARLAWCDVAQTDVVDPTMKHPERNPDVKPPIAAYAETRFIRHMPLAMMDERRQVALLLTDTAEAAAREPKPIRALDRYTEADLLAMIQAIGAPRVAELAESTVDEVLVKAGLEPLGKK